MKYVYTLYFNIFITNIDLFRISVKVIPDIESQQKSDINDIPTTTSKVYSLWERGYGHRYHSYSRGGRPSTAAFTMFTFLRYENNINLMLHSDFCFLMLHKGFCFLMLDSGFCFLMLWCYENGQCYILRGT